MKVGLKQVFDNYDTSIKYNYFFLPFVILVAAGIRIFFFNGLVFSDDSYYNQLSFTVLSGDFAKDYIGYPIFLLRKGEVYFTALTMLIFGKGEISTIILPFILSLSGIVLAYKLSLLFYKDGKTALTAAFLLAFFPLILFFQLLTLLICNARFLSILAFIYFTKVIKRTTLV